MMRNGRLLTRTRVSGGGVAITALYEGRAHTDKTFVYIYIRCDDGPVVQARFWETTAQEFFKAVGYDDVKARRVEFSGMLSGTYDDTPMIAVDLKNIEVGPYGI